MIAQNARYIRVCSASVEAFTDMLIETKVMHIAISPFLHNL